MEAAIVLCPLAGAIITAGLRSWLGARGSQWVTCVLVGTSALLTLPVFIGLALSVNEPRVVQLFTWIQSGEIDVSWSLRIDALSSVMLLLVTLVSAAVHVYSVGYMEHDPDIPRFMSLLSLFTFFMLLLVTADNFLQLFCGWEGVGLCSYLLIGFWYQRPSANDAAFKAFIVNRIGDFGFALGVMGVFVLFGTLEFEDVFALAAGKAGQTTEISGFEIHYLTLICLLLFMGAMGKSAQLGLHTWLPDAMEGPTPVSALIHAATMVTAGVFMVVRLSPLFEYAPSVLEVVTFVGATTAIFAASIAITQVDIKRVIAYSTMSQLGYMFFACGVSAYPAAIYHLLTHGFFKALLFLGAGSVIHACSGEQDMRRMGGLTYHIPYTCAFMWVGSLALVGFPFFFFLGELYSSKDVIIEAAFASRSFFAPYAFWVGLATAILTAFYSWRVILLTFHGPANPEHHPHESPAVMLVPLGCLALGSIIAGPLFYDILVGSGRHQFWESSIFILPANDSIEEAHHHTPALVALLPLVCAAVGIGLAAYLYHFARSRAGWVASQLPAVARLLANKWYVDELYEQLLVRPTRCLAQILSSKSESRIDRWGPDGLAARVYGATQKTCSLQTGYLFHYASAMLVGVLLLTSWFFWS